MWERHIHGLLLLQIPTGARDGSCNPCTSPWLGIEPLTFHYSGWCCLHWVISARTPSSDFCQGFQETKHSMPTFYAPQYLTLKCYIHISFHSLQPKHLQCYLLALCLSSLFRIILSLSLAVLSFYCLKKIQDPLLGCFL